MANSADDFKITSALCFKGIENYTLEGFGKSIKLDFLRCDQALLEEG